MKRLKIAVNTRFLLENKLEGIGWFSYEVLKRLVEWHPEVDFQFIFDRKYSEKFIFGANVQPLVAFPPARHPFLYYAFFEWAVPRILKREKSDVFFSPDGFLSLRTQVPTVMVEHDIAYKHFPEQIDLLTRKYYQYFVPKYLAKAQKVLTVSEFSKKDMVESLGIYKDKINVVYTGANPLYKPLSDIEISETRSQFSQGNPYFLYVGSIHPRKNIPRLIRAFDIFKSRTQAPHKLLLAGRMAWQTGEVSETLKGLENPDSVVFLGYTGMDVLPKIVGAAYALAYPSLFEGFGIPIIESLQCGVPVLTSLTSSMPEAAGEGGLLVDPYSVEAIAEGLIRLYQDPVLYQQCAQKGLMHAQNFSWDKTALAVWEAIAEILP